MSELEDVIKALREECFHATKDLAFGINDLPDGDIIKLHQCLVEIGEISKRDIRIKQLIEIVTDVHNKHSHGSTEEGIQLREAIARIKQCMGVRENE